MTSCLTSTLADFICDTRSADVGEAALARAELVLLDVVGCAAAGVAAPAPTAVRAALRGTAGTGDSPVWLDGTRLPPAAAILANVCAATALDLDDGHRLACGHPAAGVIPVATAVAERLGSTGTDLLAAIAIGYEVGVRIAAARDVFRLPSSATGQWLGYATAAVTARLLGLGDRATVQALAVAGAHGPSMLVNGWSRDRGNSVKEGMPWAAMAGYTAAELAAQGFTGPCDVLDGEPRHDPAAIRSGLGVDWAITRNYFKYYSACRHAHPAIDIVLDLAESGALPSPIDRVAVHTYDRALRLQNACAPATLEAAQYSLPFTIALAAVLGRGAVTLIRPEHLSHPAVVDLAHRVELHYDPVFQHRFPAQSGVRLVIAGDGRVIERAVSTCSGDWETGDNRARLHDKFEQLTRPTADAGWRRRMPLAIRGLRDGDGARTLFALLGAAASADAR